MGRPRWPYHRIQATPYGDKVVATPKPPTHTGYIRGLYWLGGADPVLANRIETILMGRIDSNAAVAHRMILNDSISKLPRNVRLAWPRFVIGLLIRSPAQVANVYKRMTTPTTQEYRELQRNYRKDFPGGRYEDLPAEVIKTGALLTTARLMQNAEVEQMLNGMIWSVYDLGLPELSFLTSDRPVVMSNGVGNKGGHLAIPISPKKLFIAFRDEKIKAEIQALSPWHIRDAVNLSVVRNAIEVVWDTHANQLKMVRENMSLEAKNDLNFFRA